MILAAVAGKFSPAGEEYEIVGAVPLLDDVQSLVNFAAQVFAVKIPAKKDRLPGNARVWLAVGRTDMRRGMNGLALLVQESLKRDPHAGDLFVFRGRKGDLVKIIWHDGLGMSLYAKRLERGRFIWPSPVDGVLAISSAQLAYMLDGIDWRNPRFTFHPDRVG